MNIKISHFYKTPNARAKAAAPSRQLLRSPGGRPGPLPDSRGPARGSCLSKLSDPTDLSQTPGARRAHVLGLAIEKGADSQLRIKPDNIPRRRPGHERTIRVNARLSKAPEARQCLRSLKANQPTRPRLNRKSERPLIKSKLGPPNGTRRNVLGGIYGLWGGSVASASAIGAANAVHGALPDAEGPFNAIAAGMGSGIAGEVGVVPALVDSFLSSKSYHEQRLVLRKDKAEVRRLDNELKHANPASSQRLATELDVAKAKLRSSRKNCRHARLKMVRDGPIQLAKMVMDQVSHAKNLGAAGLEVAGPAVSLVAAPLATAMSVADMLDSRKEWNKAHKGLDHGRVRTLRCIEAWHHHDCRGNTAEALIARSFYTVGRRKIEQEKRAEKFALFRGGKGATRSALSLASIGVGAAALAGVSVGTAGIGLAVASGLVAAAFLVSVALKIRMKVKASTSARKRQIDAQHLIAAHGHKGLMKVGRKGLEPLPGLLRASQVDSNEYLAVEMLAVECALSLGSEASRRAEGASIAEPFRLLADLGMAQADVDQLRAQAEAEIDPEQRKALLRVKIAGFAGVTLRGQDKLNRLDKRAANWSQAPEQFAVDAASHIRSVLQVEQLSDLNDLQTVARRLHDTGVTSDEFLAFAASEWGDQIVQGHDDFDRAAFNVVSTIVSHWPESAAVPPSEMPSLTDLWTRVKQSGGPDGRKTRLREICSLRPQQRQAQLAPLVQELLGYSDGPEVLVTALRAHSAALGKGIGDLESRHDTTKAKLENLKTVIDDMVRLAEQQTLNQAGHSKAA